MGNSSSFELVCAELEARTSLDRLAARGTVRIALQKAGLTPKDVTAEQMRVVVERVIPGELACRGIEQQDALVEALAAGLDQPEPGAPAASPEAVFKRFGGRI